jgi:hypothetical protein
VTVPTPSPALKVMPLPARAAPHGALDQRAMGDIRVIAGILDDPGSRKSLAGFFDGEREGRRLPAGQSHLDRIGEFSGKESKTSRLARRRRTGSRGPATTKVLAIHFHGRFYSPTGAERHRSKVRI